jgi:GT2 family glycosyltransferase
MSYRRGAGIFIPTYNGAHRVRDLLQNLRQRTSASYPFEIVVCDDSGKQAHQESVRRICADHGARFIFNQRNRGVPASWNALVRSTDHEMAVLLNDDVLLAKDWLEYLAYAVMENPRAGSFSLNCLFIEAGDAAAILRGPDAQVVPLNVRYENGVLVRNQRYPEMPRQPDGSPGRVMCPAGCAFGFRRETYDRVGGFDERYFAFYEELDFGVACAHHGMPAFTLSVPQDNYHIWSATFASAPEINAGRVMSESRAKFLAKWSGILGRGFGDAPDIHPVLMGKIPKFPVRWLGVGKARREETL